MDATPQAGRLDARKRWARMPGLPAGIVTLPRSPGLPGGGAGDLTGGASRAPVA